MKQQRIMSYGLDESVIATVVDNGEAKEIPAKVRARSARIGMPAAVEQYDVIDATGKIHPGIAVTALRKVG